MARCARLFLGTYHYYKTHNELVCSSSYAPYLLKKKKKELNEKKT